MNPRAYATADAFKAALDQRLRNVAAPGVGIARRRQLLVFDRYLARLNRVLGDHATLKGGLVLEVRLDRARTTRYIDLRVSGSPEGLIQRLQEAGRIDLGGFVTFEVRTDLRHPGTRPLTTWAGAKRSGVLGSLGISRASHADRRRSREA